MSGQERHGLLLALDAFAYPLNDNLERIGGYGPLNFTDLTITRPDPEQVQRLSKQRSSYGQALDSFSRSQPEEISFTLDDADPDILSMAMRGTPADYAQEAATDQTVSVHVYHDLWVAIGQNNLTSLSITGSTEGTDYEVDMEAGLFMALSGGNLDNDTDVDVTASWAARDGKTIVSGTVPNLNLAIVGHGINLFNNRQVDIEIFQASIAPSGDLSFISDDPVNLEFSGTLVKPSNQQGTYAYRETKAGA